VDCRAAFINHICATIIGENSVTVVNFYAIDRDAFTIKVLFAIVAILGVVLGALITRFLHWWS